MGVLNNSEAMRRDIAACYLPVKKQVTSKRGDSENGEKAFANMRKSLYEYAEKCYNIREKAVR